MLKIRIHSLVGQKTIKRKKKPKTILGSCIKLEQGKPFRNLCVECGMCVERVIDPSYIIYNYVSVCVCVCCCCCSDCLPHYKCNTPSLTSLAIIVEALEAACL